MTTHTPSEFLARMRAGTARQEHELTVSGFAKPDDSDVNGLLFSPGVTCETWLRIAIDLIDGVEHLGTVPCGDHEHPYVRLALRSPPDGNASAVLLFQLLKAGQANAITWEATTIAARLSQGESTEVPTSPSAARCIVYQGMEGLYVCCPPSPGTGGGWVCTGMV